MSMYTSCGRSLCTYGCVVQLQYVYMPPSQVNLNIPHHSTLFLLLSRKFSFESFIGTLRLKSQGSLLLNFERKQFCRPSLCVEFLVSGTLEQLPKAHSDGTFKYCIVLFLWVQGNLVLLLLQALLKLSCTLLKSNVFFFKYLLKVV